MASRSDAWLAPAEVLAGIAVARAMAEGRDLEAALVHVRRGPVDTSALDYEGAGRIAAIHGWNIFAGDNEDEAALRSTIGALARQGQAPWAANADRGRSRAMDGLDEDSIQCFRIAGLLDFSQSALGWWIELAAWSRGKRDQRKRDAGLAAERRSLAMEELRLAGLGLQIKWIAPHDGTAGYDIETWREAPLGMPGEEQTTDGRLWRRHYLEVKSALAGQEVFLSRGECDFASTHSDAWSLQVWRPGDVLSEFGWRSVRPHVPADQGRGRWEQVRIPTTALGS